MLFADGAHQALFVVLHGGEGALLQVTKAKVRARREWWEANGTGRSWAVGTEVGSRCRKSGFAPVATVHQAKKNAARLSCGMASRGASGVQPRGGMPRLPAGARRVEEKS
ncbi:hypothetical protein IMZ48_44570 [Candidatus Bathyarchaeota archaeon]|nr:hypothetical protein [Candidatus Bathyarchaeota archaeon]